MLGIQNKIQSLASWYLFLRARKKETDFKAKNITRGKDGYFIMIKGSLPQENITILMFMHLITEFQNT